MEYNVMIHNMIQMNRAVAAMCDEALASDDPHQREGAMELCDIFIRACDETQINMRKLRATLRGFDEPLPSEEVSDFEASVLSDIARLP